MERSTKQVIIIRKDLKMRRGKEISQGAHASMGALLSTFIPYWESSDVKDGYEGYNIQRKKSDNDPVMQWLKGSFTKITVTVQTEEDLLQLHKLAHVADIPNALIKDNGKTEFDGVPTHTALAIGPWWSDEIDRITGHLTLY